MTIDRPLRPLTGDFLAPIDRSIDRLTQTTHPRHTSSRARMPEEEGAEEAEETMARSRSGSTTRMEEGDGANAPPSIPSAAVASKSKKKRPRPPAHEWGLDPLFWVRMHACTWGSESGRLIERVTNECVGWTELLVGPPVLCRVDRDRFELTRSTSSTDGTTDVRAGACLPARGGG